jgi:hypothetical protein
LAGVFEAATGAGFVGFAAFLTSVFAAGLAVVFAEVTINVQSTQNWPQISGIMLDGIPLPGKHADLTP